MRALMMTKKAGWGGWQPGVNTVLYYEFDWNLNDSSWNNRNQSVWVWSFTYWDTWFGAKYVQTALNSSTWRISIPYNFTAYTVNVWLKVPNRNSNWIWLDFHSWNNYFTRIASDWNKLYWIVSNANYFTIPDFDKWYNVCVIEENKITYLYVNWNLITQSNANYNTTTANFTINTAWDYPSSQNFAWIYQFSNLIAENKARTVQEISDYYNSTKWDYWIS